MKKSIFNGMLVLFLTIGVTASSSVFANNKKPPRPEKIEEVRSDRPSEYHVWISGRWKWKRKIEEWEWHPGYWRFDRDLYYVKNRWRYSGFYRPWRYIAIPIGRGYYRIVRY